MSEHSPSSPGPPSSAVTLNDELDGARIEHRVVNARGGRLLAIDEINAEQLDADTFRHNYLEANRPLCIRNGLGVLDCGTAYSRWSLDYLVARCGDNRVHVRRNTLAADYKTGRAYTVQEVTFAQHVRELRADSAQSRNSYLAVQNVKKAFPQVADEMRLPAALVGKLHAGPFLWIARAGHYEYMHMDPDDNLLMVLRGRKLVRLYGCDVHSMRPNELGSKGRTIQAQVDCDHPPEQEQPQPQANACNRPDPTPPDCHYCLLRDGDILFFPAFWWHQVSSPALTLSMNVFFGDAGDNAYTAKLLRSPLQRDALLYWLCNIVAQNAPHPSYPRLLANLRASLHAFLFKQWHETLDTEQVEWLHERIVAHFGLDERVRQLCSDPALEMRAKNPPELRIRGLLMRPKEVDDD